MAYYEYTFPTSNGYIIGSVVLSSTSNGSAANTSNASVRVWFRRTNNYATSYGRINTGCQCDTQSQWENNFSVSLGTGWVLTYSKGFYGIPHNSDGSKTCYLRVCGNANFSLGNFDSSWNVALDKIPRYTSVTEFEPVEIKQTCVKFRWKTADNISEARTYLNGSQNWTNNPGAVSGSSGEFIFNGSNDDNNDIPKQNILKPGTSYNVKLGVKRADSGLWSYSSPKSFTTLPMTTITNSSIDFNIGEDLLLTFKDWEQNKVFLALDVQRVDETWEEVVKTDEVIQAESYNWNLSTIAGVLYQKVPTRNSANIRIRCGATIDGNLYYNTLNGIMSVINSDPVFSEYEYGDKDNITQNVLQNITYMPENYGKMTADISINNKAIAKNAATITKYIAKITDSKNAAILEAELPYSEKESVQFVFGNFQKADTYKINIYAIDSRNNITQTISKTFYVLPYSDPLTKINLNRLNNYEEETVVSIDCTYSKLLVGNIIKNDSLIIKYHYCEIDKDYGSEYTTLQLGNPQNKDTNNLNILYNADPFVDLQDNSNKMFKFEFVITDRLTSNSIEIQINQGIPVMFMSDNGKVSIAMIPRSDDDNKLQVQSDITAKDNYGVLRGIFDTLNNLFIVSENEPTNQIVGGIWVEETLDENVEKMLEVK